MSAKLKKKVKDCFFGSLLITGMVIIMCCDTETPVQLLIILLTGFGLLGLGGRGILVNNRRTTRE